MLSGILYGLLVSVCMTYFCLTQYSLCMIVTKKVHVFLTMVQYVSMFYLYDYSTVGHVCNIVCPLCLTVIQYVLFV